MTEFALLSAAALVGLGALTTAPAEARGGGALAAGLVGGLAAGALLGAAMSEAHAGPAYGYEPAPPVAYRPARYRPEYADEAPVYGSPRFDDGYAPAGYGYAPHRRHRDYWRDRGGW